MATKPSPALDDLPKVGGLQYALIGAGVAIALLMIVLAAVYSGGSDDTGPIISGGPVDGGGDRDNPETGETEVDVNPVEAFLPSSGEGSTCTERVGVDLIPGYSATLTINGVEIPETEMYGFETGQGASTLGEFSWGPEEGCPRGEILRPQGNRLEACVYRNLDGPDSCRVVVHTFDAL